MKRTIQIIFAISLIIIIGGVAALNTSIWKDQIESYINRELMSDSEWTISIGSLNGNLLFEVTGTDIKVLNNKNEVFVKLPVLSFDLDILSFMSDSPKLKFIEANDFLVSIEKGEKSDVSIQSNEDMVNIPFQVERLNLSGRLHIPMIDPNIEIKTELTGSILKENGKTEWNIRDFVLTDNDSLVCLSFEKLSVEIDSTMIVAYPLIGEVSSIPIDGKIVYSPLQDEKLRGIISFKDYTIPENLYTKIPLKHKFSKISGEVSVVTDFQSLNGNLILENELGLNMSGDFSLTQDKDHVLLNHLNLQDDDTQLSIGGLVERSGRITGRTELSDFDISQWLVDQRKTNLNGVLLLNGNTDQGQITDITMTVEVIESMLYSKDAISLSGSVSYHDSVLTFLDPLFVGVGPSSIQVQGKADLQSNDIDVSLDLDQAGVFLINNFWADTLKQGTATGSLKIQGSLTQPEIRGEVNCENVIYKDFYLGSALLNLNINNGFDVTDGFVHLQFEEGIWYRKEKEYHWDHGTLDASFYPDKIDMENLHIFSGDNFIQLSADLKRNNSATINRIQILYDQHYLINPKPLDITYGKQKINLKQFLLHIDDGIVEGYFSKGEEIDALIKLSNIDAGIVSYLTDDARMKMNGTAFGECSMKISDQVTGIAVDLTIKEGEFANQPFNDMILSFFIHDGILSIENISLTNRGLTGAQISGMIPLKDTAVKIPFNLESSFHNLNIEVFTQFIPNWFQLGGQISGNYNLSGNSNQTKFDFEVEIENAKFDRIPLGFVTGNGFYDGTFLNFASFSSEFGEKHLEGSASLPIDFNIGSDRFGRALMKDPVQVDVKGEGDELWFMDPYISILDSTKTDFDMVLQIFGTWENLIRDGSVVINGGTIHTSLLEDPIYNISGSGTWENNQLIIPEIKGLLKETKTNKQNFAVSGQLDMSKFFRPDYDLNVTGKSIYFSAITEELSGTVNVDVQIAGKDTITIEGTIPVIDVEMYKEFTESSVGSEVSKSENAIIMNYQVQFPIEGDFTLLNNQIDATFGGEVSISQIGYSPADFSGEVFVKEGKFYYSSDIFNITEGFLSFGKKGFNPYMDITASTFIDNEEITIAFIGLLENPKLILTSESGFSQSDILELLTWGKRFEDQEFSSTGFGTQAIAKIESWFEQQLDRKLMQISGLDNLGILDKVSITGTGALINPSNGEEFTIKAGLSDNISLNYAYKRSFSLTNPSHAVGMEYKMNRYISIIGNIDEQGKVHAKYKLRYSY